MKIILSNTNLKIQKEEILRPAIGKFSKQKEKYNCNTYIF